MTVSWCEVKIIEAGIVGVMIFLLDTLCRVCHMQDLLGVLSEYSHSFVYGIPWRAGGMLSA